MLEFLSRHHIGISLLLGFLLDARIGDPKWIPHPVRWIGRWVQFLEKRLLRAGDAPLVQTRKGILLVLLTVLPAAGLTAALLAVCYGVHVLLGLAVETAACCYCLAARDLFDSSMDVYTALHAGSLPAARDLVGRIVGRDTEALDAQGVIRAAVETVAENLSDGVIAPMIFLALLGPAGGMAYKAVNTLDSMVGYRNGKYRYFGTAAARTDDVLNFIPARLSALLIILSARILRLNAKNAWRIFRRDRYAHASPNAGQTEAACAGALGIRLGGDASYGGVPVHKPTLGDPNRMAESGDIVLANRLMILSSAFALGICLILRIIF